MEPRRRLGKGYIAVICPQKKNQLLSISSQKVVRQTGCFLKRKPNRGNPAE